MIIVLYKKASTEEIGNAMEEFGNYIKIVADIEKGIIAIGEKYHADAEKVLIENGSAQQNLWGGGFDPANGKFDFQAIINIRPRQNNDSMEILDPIIRNTFESIAEKFLK